MKKRIAFIVVFVVLNSGWFAYSKITVAQQEAAYKRTVAPYQHDLPLGTARAEVQNYLESKKLDYRRVRFGGDEADSYEVQIGTEPASLFSSLFCEDWEVYVILEFSAADNLKNVRIAKFNTCM